MSSTIPPSRTPRTGPESGARAVRSRGGPTARRASMVALSAMTSVAMLGISAPAASADSVWDRVAACESGGNWSISTGNGYYGGLQFYQPTWVGYGGREFASYAHRASKAEQIAVAQRVLAAQGPGAWPVCSVRAGLTRSNGGANPNAQPGGGTSSGTGATVTRYVSASTSANVRSGPGTGYRIVGSIDRGERVTGRLSGGWLRLSSGRYLGPAVLSSRAIGGGGGGGGQSSSTVTRYISANTSANVRSGPSTGYRIVGSEPRGERVRGTLVGGWLRVSNGRYIGPAVLSSRAVGGGGGQGASPSTVTRYVSANSAAYVRSGPSTRYRVVDSERRGTRVRGTLVSGWLKIGNSRYIGPAVLSRTAV